ncbi:hypothetical protein EON66_02430 [archaeon]|nr:MAG: hypothetical protein EON66_02430 [archaeon]
MVVSTAAAPVAPELNGFQRVVGVLLFITVWLLLLKDHWRSLPLGRAGGTLVGAAITVALGLLTPDAALACINLPTIALLTGCMLISAVMDKRGLFVLLGQSLVARGSPLSLLLRVIGVASVSSALLTNDTTCVILTPVIGRACATRRLHPAPYLIALATASNIGSACSPIGNPQNMLIALSSGLSFPKFLGYILISTLVGTLLNAVYIVFLYRPYLLRGKEYAWSAQQLRELGMLPVDAGTPQPDAPRVDARGGEPATSTQQLETVSLADNAQATASAWWESTLSDTVPPQGCDAMHSTTASQGVNIGASGASRQRNAAPGLPAYERDAPPSASLPASVTLAPPPSIVAHTAPAAPGINSIPLVWRVRATYAILALLPIALLFADRWIGLSWVTLLAASMLCVLDGEQPEPLFQRVDAQLLLFFSGLFVVVSGFNATGVPEWVWNLFASGVSMHTLSGLILYTVIILVGSNTVSNVPLVLLLSPKIATLGADAQEAWAQLAFISTVAGNLTLLGSVANLIVAERAKNFYPLTFSEYLKVGFPATVVICCVGVPLVTVCAKFVD